MADAELRFRARNDTKAVFAEILSSTNALRSALGALGVGISIAGIVEFGRKAVDMVASLDTLSKQARVSVEFLDQLRQVAHLTGQEFAPLSDAVGKFTTELAKAQGGDPQLVKIFQNLGISAKELKAVAPEELFQRVAVSLGQAGNQATAGAYSVALMGKSARELAPIFDEIATRGLPVARVFTAMAKEADDAQRKMREFGSSMQTLSIAVGGGLAERFLALSEAVTKTNTSLTEFVASFGAAARAILYGGEISQAQKSYNDAAEAALAARKKLDTLQTPPGPAGASVYARSRSALEQEISYQEGMMRQATARLNVARGLTPTGDPKPIVFPPNTGPQPQLPDLSPAIGSQGPKFADYLKTLQNELSKTASEGNKVAEVQAEILSGAKGAATSDQAQQALAIAAQMNQLQSLTRMRAEDAQQQSRDEQERAAYNTAEAARLEGLVERYKNLADPMREYRKNLADIDLLTNRPGGLTPQQAMEARGSYTQQFNEANKQATQLSSSLFDVTEATQQMGLVFQSATGSAIANFKDLGSVLQGVLLDILQLTARMLILEPLWRSMSPMIAGLLGAPTTAYGGVFTSGGNFSDMFQPRASGGPVSAGSTYLVGENGPELLRMGSSGYVSPGGGGVTINVIGAQGPVTARRREDPMGGLTLDLVIDSMSQQQAADISSGRGALPAILERTYGLSRVPGSVR